MTRIVKVRRWDEKVGYYRWVSEAWPTAVVEPDGSGARVEGPGWVLRLEGELPPDAARRIVEDAAGAIEFHTGPTLPEAT